MAVRQFSSGVLAAMAKLSYHPVRLEAKHTLTLRR
jgi:hypothetical protein